MNNVYQMVTDRIVEQMQQGIIAWRKPWTGTTDGAISYTNRRAYSLLNQFLLGEAGEYLTFNEIRKLGGTINKGAKSKFVVFYKQMRWTEKNEQGEDVEKSFPMLRYYNVFHIKDTTGINSKCKSDVEYEPKTNAEIDALILDYVTREGIKFQNDRKSNRAYYSPVSDEVVVPMPNQYAEIAEYYSTTFHELTHSTLPERRCNRVIENRRAFFGNEDYSREELVAEIGSAMLCTRLGVSVDKAFKNSVAYIQSWIKALKNDPKMIVWASSRAEKAAKYILNETDDAK